MIDLRKLKELVELMVSNDLTELDVQGKDDRITLKRASGAQTVQYIAPPPAGVPAAGSPAVPTQASTAPQDAGDTLEGPDDTAKITSPMVGTFYAASSPDAQPFVSVGDKVEPDTVVCIVEAMKVFNEIKAETSGTITKVLVNTGQAVEFEQPLFEIKPG